MTALPARLRRSLVALAVIVIGLGGFVTPAAPAEAAKFVPISGTGSTWSENALQQWRRNVAGLYGMQINYSGTGSSRGRLDFIAQTVDFAVSEIPFQAQPEDGSAPEKPAAGYAYMPIVAGGTSFMYNLKINGKRVTNLRLSGETITKIFTGKITKWTDKQVQKDNPGLKMPDKAIVPVVRSDGSGSTAQFTLWMSKEHGSLWNDFCKSVGRGSPCGLTSQYPGFGSAKLQNGSSGVAGYVSQDYGEGAITYVEYSYALKAKFPVAKVLNAAGYYVEPTQYSVAVALLQAKINENPKSPDYLTQILDGVYDNKDPRSYPLSSYSYLIVPTEVSSSGSFSKAKGATLGAFGNYLLCEGQQQAGALGYSPLPMNLVTAGFTQIERIPGAENVKPKLEKCNNPTFKAGDSPKKNQLAQTAPMPADCDKVGTQQCTTGTAGAANTKTDTTGSGTGGEATGGSGGSGGTGESGGAGTSSGGDDALPAGEGDGATGLDGSGEYVDAAGAGAAATASPFTLPASGWGGSQLLILTAGALLLAAMVVPPLVGSRTRKAEK